MRTRLPSIIRIVAPFAVASALVLSTATSATAAESDDILVFPDDISDTNVSADRPTAIWDGTGFDEFTNLPTAGSKWVLDIENKLAGDWRIDEDGLAISLLAKDPDASTTSKVRLQYYIGTGGYPEIDGAAPVLADLFDETFSWKQEQIVGDPNYGITLEIQLQKEVSEGAYDRVTVVSRWNALPETRDFGAGLWWANAPTPGDGLGQWAGVEVDELLNAYGDYEVVSFGPNLGSGWDEVTRIQDLQVLGQTFHFAPAEPTELVEPGDPETFPGELELDDTVLTSSLEAGGNSVTINLGPEYAYQWIHITLHSDPTSLGWFLTDGNGIVTFTVPSTVPSGTHTVAAHDGHNRLVGYVDGLVVPAADEDDGNVLPATGAEIVISLSVAALLLLTGLTVVAVRTRQPNSDQ